MASSSVFVECLFLSAALTANGKRSNLKPYKLEQILFVPTSLTFSGPAKKCNLLARPWVQKTRRGFSGITVSRKNNTVIRFRESVRKDKRRFLTYYTYTFPPPLRA